MRESIFHRYERLTREEVLEDEGLNEEALQALGVNGWSLQKRKHQIKQLIEVLERLPRINNKRDDTLRIHLLN